MFVCLFDSCVTRTNNTCASPIDGNVPPVVLMCGFVLWLSPAQVSSGQQQHPGGSGLSGFTLFAVVSPECTHAGFLMRFLCVCVLPSVVALPVSA